MQSKRLLFVSLSGLIGDIAWQIQKEGHEVRYFLVAARIVGRCTSPRLRAGSTPRSSFRREPTEGLKA